MSEVTRRRRPVTLLAAALLSLVALAQLLRLVLRFEVVVGTVGDLKGVPLVIEWQPRWWLRATLRLQEG